LWDYYVVKIIKKVEKKGLIMDIDVLAGREAL